MAARDRHARCSFCLKDEKDVARIITGSGSYICDECVALGQRILDGADGADGADGESVRSDGGIQPSQLSPWSQLSDQEVLDRLPKLVDVVAQVEVALDAAVGEARRRSVPWARIGTALGTSRQSAWERFAGSA